MLMPAIAVLSMVSGHPWNVPMSPPPPAAPPEPPDPAAPPVPVAPPVPGVPASLFGDLQILAVC
jgi:hypothetical protein